jgi:Xaa-Pro aminopeptidase
MIERRISRLRAELQRRGLDALVVSLLPHVRYLTGFTGSNGITLVKPRSVSLYTDSRYGRQAGRETRGIRCRIVSGELAEVLGKDLASMGNVKVGFESLHLPVHSYDILRKNAPRVRFVASKGIVESLASVKEKQEIGSIRRAVAISDLVFGEILGRVRPGVSERDIAAEVSFLHKRFGGEGDAFEPIVAAGRRSALPHARPAGRVLRSGEHILLDFGCTVDGYHSDMTRVIAVGRVSSRVRRMHAAVLDAREVAISAARAGVAVRELDAMVRKRLRSSGLSRFFVHSLGHGIGLQIHERPRISTLSDEVLAAGNVVTIEPGVYVPSVGGVRIEDDLLIKADGCEVLNRASRELLVV